MSDTIDSITNIEGTPTVVHISDIHGYIDDARSALLALGETETYDPIVVTDQNGRLQWADNDYILVINGDLIDRGPANRACVEMVWRLLDEAPEGRVRYLIGNHELPILMPRLLGWPGTYSTELDTKQRKEFLERILDGEIAVAFDGYLYTYSHAGSNDPIDPSVVNSNLREATETIVDNMGDRLESRVHRQLTKQYDRIFALSSDGGRGKAAGICWIDFQHLEKSAPPQIVGHSMRNRPVRKGNVVCGNIIRINEDSKGGEGVLVETPDGLTFVRRERDGTVSTTQI